MHVRVTPRPVMPSPFFLPLVAQLRWTDIAEQIPGRSSKQCRERWQNHLEPSIKKSACHLCSIDVIHTHATQHVCTRHTNLDPPTGRRTDGPHSSTTTTTPTTAEWTAHEDRILVGAQRRYGNKWAEIARLLPGRPENSVKNRYVRVLGRREAGGFVFDGGG